MFLGTEGSSDVTRLGGVRRREERTALDVGGSAQDSMHQKMGEGRLKTRKSSVFLYGEEQ